MCNISQSIVNQVEAVIDSFTQRRAMFTAFDVTSELRKQNVPNLPKHYELKDAVHDMFNSNRMNRDYIRTQRHVAGPNLPSAFVYHPYDEDAANYVSPNYTNVSGAVVTPVVSTPTVSPVSNGSRISNRNTNVRAGTVVADARGRVHVPKKFLASIGLDSNDEAYVQRNGNIINIFKRAQPNAANVKRMAVDCYTNMKVAVGADNAGKVYTFTVNGRAGQVTIS